MVLRQLVSVDDALGWLARCGVAGLTTDSRRVRAGDAFIAWPGYAVDGRRFVGDALAAGARACLVEAEGADVFDAFDTQGGVGEPAALDSGRAPEASTHATHAANATHDTNGTNAAYRVAALPDLKARTGEIASGFMGAPSHALEVFAVTGTNGKTSISWWLAQALSQLGQRCGVIGTLGVGEPPRPDQSAAIAFTGMTTPDPVTVQAGFKQFADAGFQACAVEATSIGIAEHRLAGTRITVALFTHLTQDHLDYHGSMEAYWQAKARLFAWPGLRAAVINVDDAHGATLARELQGRGALDVWTYSAQGAAARLSARSIGYDAGGLCFELREHGSEAAAQAHAHSDASRELHPASMSEAIPHGRIDVRTGLIGDYNVANLLAVIGGLRAAGISLDAAVQACTGLTPVPGRMQRVAAERVAPAPPAPASSLAGASDPPLAAASDRQLAAASAPSPWAKPAPPGVVTRAPQRVVAPAPQLVVTLAPQLVVDYAHTPDALDKALRALQPFATQRGGALWCVFGCGGNRDAGKRPLMAAIAQQLAQRVVVTTDNPRHEAPELILLQIAAGFTGDRRHIEVIEDRRAAIAHAVHSADARDVILVAGKGHEAYQDIAGVKHPFSDVDEAASALALREGTAR